MPPTKAKQPSGEERTLLSLWIKWTVDNIDPSLVVKDPGFIVLHWLTKTEFDNIYCDLLGIKCGLAVGFLDDIGGNSGFDNSADSLSSPSLFIEKLLAASAEGLNQASVSKLFVRQPTDAMTPRDQRDLAKENLTAFAGRAWRRPARPRELDQLLLLFDLYAKKKNQTWEIAMRQVYRQVLTSPAFIYRAEEVRSAERAPYEIGQYDMANRLSYFLWSSMPDDALMALAAEGKLHQPDIIAQQVTRMLADPKAAALGGRFLGQWLDTEALRRGGGPDPKEYPAFTEQMRESMCDEPGQFFAGLLADNGSLLDLIDSDYVYVNEDTAKIYDIRGVSGRAFRKMPRPGPDRGGVIAMPAVLSLTSYPRRTSPVLRGAWVLTHLLNAPPPPPPPNVPALDDEKAPEKVAKEQTLRERLTAHRADPACSSCHSRIDPIGFGLEGYDAIGSSRTRDEHGNKLDLNGTLLTGETFSGAAELKQVLLKRSDAVIRLVVEQLLAYALGRKLEPFDRPTVSELTRNLIADKYRVRGLVLGIAASYPMRFKRNQPITATGMIASGD
ncbi:MAG TPA: DUF1592 domain-containing protein, partial [Planctomycetota bacterium]|nr:DUF1592 domain-containing protein [Planctomycetota bacterium]